MQILLKRIKLIKLFTSINDFKKLLISILIFSCKSYIYISLSAIEFAINSHKIGVN